MQSIVYYILEEGEQEQHSINHFTSNKLKIMHK